MSRERRQRLTDRRGAPRRLPTVAQLFATLLLAGIVASWVAVAVVLVLPHRPTP